MKRYANAALCPLYAAPEDGAERVDELLFGMAAAGEEVRDGWVKVRTDYGYTGWAEERLLSAPAPGWEKGPDLRMTGSPWCDVTAAPRVEAPVLATLPRGGFALRGGEPENGWLPVVLPDGRKGYTKSHFWSEYDKAASVLPEPELRQAVCRAARSYLGTPYRWGGKSPMGIDCSGLAFMAYHLNAVTIFRDARMEEGYPIRPIPRSRLRPADLLYWKGHVAVYLGEERFLHATARAGSGAVVVNSLDPRSPDCRADLLDPPPVCGSLFP